MEKVKSQYLLRFDDVCPTMNWKVWNQVEKLLIEYQVKPLLAVVPDCQDPHLQVAEARSDFWELMQSWQERGWTLAMHGYQHNYVNHEPGLLKIQNESEFAGLSEAEQSGKIQKSLAIFQSHGLSPNIFVAPSHSFDQATLRALQKNGLDCVSDGFGFTPWMSDPGLLFIPQQMWRFRPMPPGVWTVCLHPNHWGSEQLKQLEADLQVYSQQITDFSQVREQYWGKSRGWIGDLGAQALQWAFHFKRAL